MSQRKITMVRKQLRECNKKEVSLALTALKGIASLPLRQRLWFAWRIVALRRFD